MIPDITIMSATHIVLACLLSALPGPPGVRYEDAYIQLFPIDKTKCSTIDPVRDIAYQLYTRNNPLMADVLRIGDDDALAHSHMNFSDPTVIFFHAFFESSTGTTAWTIKTAFLQRKQHNLILLNAPRLEAGPWYFTAARNTRVVGEYTANFIDYLVSRGMPLQSLHLIGLSLGAQMAGVTGANVRSGRVPRITGLDPAGPVFTKLPKSLKLDKSDAEFVDVIHTDAGIFGYPRSIGHVDFWPTQGISPQPGCTFKEIKKRTPDTILELFFCSHWRSYQFYAESIVNENAFLAVSCKSWREFVNGKCNPNQFPINMGYSVPITARGNYYLQTNPESPFSLEGNPRTFAESKYIEENSFYPAAIPQFSISANSHSIIESEHQDYGNMDVEAFLQENFKTLKKNLFNTNDYNDYYPTSNAGANHYLPAVPVNKENAFNTYHNDNYPLSNAETNQAPLKKENVDNPHHNNNYTSSNAVSNHYSQEVVKNNNNHNYNNYPENVYNNDYTSSNHFVPETPITYQDNKYYPSNVETNHYSLEAPPNNENEYNDYASENVVRNHYLQEAPLNENNVHSTNGGKYNNNPTTNSEKQYYLPVTPPKKEAHHNNHYPLPDSETKLYLPPAPPKMFSTHQYYY